MNNISKTICALLASLIIVLTFSCVFQIVSITQETYLAQKYQEKINMVTREATSSFQENEKLSLGVVEEMMREKNFTNSGSVSYVEVLATEVVVR